MNFRPYMSYSKKTYSSRSKSTGAKTSKPKSRSPKKRGKKSRRTIRISIPIAIALAIAVVFLVFHPILGNKEIEKAEPDDNGKTAVGAMIPRGNYKYGFDVSHYNEDGIVWKDVRILVDRKNRTIKSLKNSKDVIPVSFVVIKATEGTAYPDSKFKKFWDEAGQTDIQRGAYHFFRSGRDPEQQANFFISVVGKLRDSDLPPILDLETRHKGCSKATLNERALTWLRLVGRHYGRKPIVYTSTDFVNLYLSPEITENYQIWISDFRDQQPVINNWYVWQFTDKAVVYGVPGYVDLNVMKIN